MDKKSTRGTQPAAKAATAAKVAKVATVAKAAKAAKPAPAAKRPAAKKAAPPPAPLPVEKPVKLKLVRDSFTIPADEYDVIGALKRRSALLGSPAKKSEVLRAGVKALAAMDDAQLGAALAAVPAIKTGRPKAKKA